MSIDSRFARDHRILLASSALLIRRNLVLFLQREGLDVVTAGGGREVLLMTPRLRPSVIILEADLPDLSGVAVCQCLRELPQVSAIPVILYTADPSQEFEAMARAAGAHAVLAMPLDGNDIMIKVANAILNIPTPGDAAAIDVPGGTTFSTVVKETRPGRQVVLEWPTAPLADFGSESASVPAVLQFVDAAHTRTTWSGLLAGGTAHGLDVQLLQVTERLPRRTALRKPVDLPVRYEFHADGHRWGRVADLSVGGFRMVGSGAPPAVGDLGELSFTLGMGGRPIRLVGSVRWAKSGEGGAFQCGVAFCKVPEDVRDSLVAFLFDQATVAPAVAS